MYFNVEINVSESESESESKPDSLAVDNVLSFQSLDPGSNPGLGLCWTA
jgi:hypothetical protein